MCHPCSTTLDSVLHRSRSSHRPLSGGMKNASVLKDHVGVAGAWLHQEGPERQPLQLGGEEETVGVTEHDGEVSQHEVEVLRLNRGSRPQSAVALGSGRLQSRNLTLEDLSLAGEEDEEVLTVDSSYVQEDWGEEDAFSQEERAEDHAGNLMMRRKELHKMPAHDFLATLAGDPFAVSVDGGLQEQKVGFPVLFLHLSVQSNLQRAGGTLSPASVKTCVSFSSSVIPPLGVPGPDGQVPSSYAQTSVRTY